MKSVLNFLSLIHIHFSIKSYFIHNPRNHLSLFCLYIRGVNITPYTIPMIKKFTRRILFFSALTTFVLQYSCVSVKKIEYLQAQEKKAVQDSVSFSDQYTPVVLEEGDMISVNIQYVDELGEDHILASEQYGPANPRSHPHLLGYSINQEGEIEIPLLGRIKVAGMDIKSCEDKIREEAKKIYASPSVKIFLLNFTVTVLGEVESPGSFNIYDNKINVLDAIGLARGLKLYANRKKVKLLRSRGGTTQIYQLDLTDEKIADSRILYLQPGDVLMVKPLKGRKYANQETNMLLRSASLIVSVISVIIAISKT